LSSMQLTDEGMLSAKMRFLIFSLLLAIPFLAYVNTFHNDFVWDDRYVLSENPYIRHMENIPSFFTTSKTQASYDMKVYRPLRQVMFAIEYKMFGPNPSGYHLQNVFVHSMNCLLLFLLLRHLRLSALQSFLVSTLYSVHPVNTEAAANIAGRADVLFLFFYLIGVIFYIKSRYSPRRRLYLVGVVVAYSLSLLSKEMAISFPLTVVLIDIFLEGGQIAELRKKLSFYLMLTVLSGLYLYARTLAIGDLGRGEYYGDSFWTTMFTQTAIVLKYIKLVFIPYPLSARYDIFLLVTPVNPYTVIFLFLIALLIVATVVSLSRKTFSLPLLGSWWFILTLLPVSNVIPIRAAMMAERYLYLPVIGLLILTASAFKGRRTFHLTRTTVPALGSYVAVLSLFFILTLSRNAVWKNDITLFEDTRSKAPDSLAVHWNLFNEYQKRGDGEKAAAEYGEMKRINEKVSREYLALARKYRESGKRADAARLARKALRTKPDLQAASDFLRELEKDAVIHLD